MHTPEQLDKATWAVCPLVKSLTAQTPQCDKCPQWTHDPDHGECQQLCRGIAEEIALAALVATK